ncbi:N-acetyltransferase family protein [Anaerobacillus isosaccharinicus]|uniref:GNAT family N-acetyltransferase n=1 Tax=Anaerobacillus isosaccharinicus TaxID=1532552 RepID=A0A1S2L5K7_9BACI|nr:GNAT family N-acetyltransferase [Anaerobacillus isosaccharinicus]MBA5586352.1 GNAT family N-acetyltransferase [Anaerobacillus isosaccharinicus]QOY35401.1 GNAT family N-acetyltransferase [Anaerobacillus isosaccharinicus]
MIRRANKDDWKGISRVHVDCMHSAYQGVLPAATLDKFTYIDREKRWQNDLPNSIRGGTMNYVAVDKNGEIVGFALAGTMRDPRLRIKYTGEIYGIYVHPEAQGQGFGKKLFESVTEHLVSHHHTSIALWTFNEHSSCNFFEHLGGINVYEKTNVITGKELEECAYGWDDLQDITCNIEVQD